MRARIDIENSKTRNELSLDVPVIEYIKNKKIVFDISEIKEKELLLLVDAINPKLTHTDIEMFYLDIEDHMPNFGPDYDFLIEGDTLCGHYTRDQWLSERRKING